MKSNRKPMTKAKRPTAKQEDGVTVPAYEAAGEMLQRMIALGSSPRVTPEEMSLVGRPQQSRARKRPKATAQRGRQKSSSKAA